MNNYEKWYKRSDVKFELIKFLKNREFVMLIPSWVTDKEVRRRSTRMLKCHSVQHFDYLMQVGLKVFKRETPYNLYYSLMRYKEGIPNQTLNFYERDNEDWKKTHFLFMESYDFLLDIDCSHKLDIPMAYESAKAIKQYFDKLNIPFELRYSGLGFHFIIPYSYFAELKLNPHPYHWDSIYKFYYKIAQALNNRFSEMIDLNIYDSRRVVKVPYSIALYEKESYLCLPFTNNEQFENFNLDYFKLESFIKSGESVRGKDRKLFNPEGTILSLVKDLKVEHGKEKTPESNR